MRPVVFLRAAAAALVTPAYLVGDRWRALLVLDARADATHRAETAAARDVARIAGGITRRLARVPVLPWRSTCLYRAVAATLALRWSGVPAVLRIGVASGGESRRELAAHAWVEAADGSLLYEQRGSFVTLSPARQPIL
jgi:hypothetical protein